VVESTAQALLADLLHVLIESLPFSYPGVMGCAPTSDRCGPQTDEATDALRQGRAWRRLCGNLVCGDCLFVVGDNCASQAAGLMGAVTPHNLDTVAVECV
jgi:hypothetical protein